MANKLYIWSNIPGQWYKASTKSDAVGRSSSDRQAGNRVLVEEVKSIDALIELYKRLSNQSDVWNAVSFYTHGAGGQIALGSSTLWYKELQRFENQDFERMFAKDCVITFEGCNVGEGAAGEYFLTQVAETCLSVQGGKARGSTGFGLGYWGGDSSVHPFGSWVVANVGPGGSLRLENGTHLHRDHIQARIQALEKRIAEYRDWPDYGDEQLLKQWLKNAKDWGTEGWHARLNACLWLEKAEAKFGEVDMSRARRARGH